MLSKNTIGFSVTDGHICSTSLVNVLQPTTQNKKKNDMTDKYNNIGLRYKGFFIVIPTTHACT